MSTKLARNSAFFVVAAVVPRAASLLLLPLLTLFLTVDEFGTLALVQAFTALFGVLLALQLHSSVGRFYFEHAADPQRIRAFLGSILILATGVATAFVLLLELAGPALVDLMFTSQSSYRPAFSLGMWTMWASAIGAVPFAVLRAQQRAGAALGISLASTLASVVATGVLVAALDLGLVGALVASLLAECVTAFAALGATFRSYLPVVDVSLVREPIAYSLPIIPHALSGYLFMYSDRVILDRYASVAAIGVYALAGRLAISVKLLVNSFNDAFQPAFMRESVARGAPHVEGVSPIAIAATAVICWIALGLAAFSPEVVAVVSSPDYAEAWRLIPLLALAYVFRLLYVFYTGATFYRKRTGVIATITFTAALTSILLNLLLVPRFGVVAAAWSTLAAFVVTAALAYAFDPQANRAWPSSRLLVLVGGAAGGAAAAFALHDSLPPLASLLARSAVVAGYALAVLADPRFRATLAHARRL